MKRINLGPADPLLIPGVLAAGCNAGSDNPEPVATDTATSSMTTHPAVPSYSSAVPDSISDVFPGDRAVSVARFWEVSPGLAPKYPRMRNPLLLDIVHHSLKSRTI